MQNRLADIPVYQKESNLEPPSVNLLQPAPVQFAQITARDSIFEDGLRWSYAYADQTNGTTNDVEINLSDRTERFITFAADLPTAGQLILIKDSTKKVVGFLTCNNNRWSIPVQRKGLFYLKPPATAGLNYVVIAHDYEEMLY